MYNTASLPLPLTYPLAISTLERRHTHTYIYWFDEVALHCRCGWEKSGKIRHWHWHPAGVSASLKITQQNEPAKATTVAAAQRNENNATHTGELNCFYRKLAQKQKKNCTNCRRCCRHHHRRPAMRGSCYENAAEAEHLHKIIFANQFAGNTQARLTPSPTKDKQKYSFLEK